jgi:ATP-dependent Clp protease ATP-binding subunit ClpC
MTGVKVPVLVSKYAEDVFTARVIDGPHADVAGVTAAAALQAVRSYLRKQAAREPYQYWPGIETYELHQARVRVRLQYREGKRQFPASREMRIAVRYVLGRYLDNSVECFLPDFNILFHCPAPHELSQLIDEAVRSAAAQLSSREIASAALPQQSELRWVRLRLKPPRAVPDDSQTETLTAVAEPVFKQTRKRSSVAVGPRGGEVAKLVTWMADSSVLLVGPAGCGKTTIARQAAVQLQLNARAQARAEGNPPPLVWESSAEQLIAGMQYLGEWEQRLERVIAELESIHGLLLIRSLIDLVRLGGTQESDSLAAFLMPWIRRGELRLVAEATAEERDAARRLLPGWTECFQIMHVDPLSHEQTRDIAQSLLNDASRNERIEVEPSAAQTATRLFAQFLPYQSPPQGVIQLVSDALHRARGGRYAAQRQDQPAARVTKASIVDQFTRLTGLPPAILHDSLTICGAELRERFGSEVLGQSAAVEVITNVVLRMKAGLCDPRRPVASMLFCGPTGVGKTQLARSLADYLFGQSESSEQPLVRLDMSEYGNWDAVDRFLIGAGGEVASWLARLRARPMSVVLLDEFEKSSPEVHDCLLSALDEGRLTDRFGRTTSLCGAIVILTSNVGSRSASTIGFGGNDARAIRREIERSFRPEFLNRLDEVVTFQSLPPAVIQQIVEKELRALAERETLLARRVRLVWDESLVQRLSAVGFDPLLGARPLQRAIERQVVARLARRLLQIGATSGPIVIELGELLGEPERGSSGAGP